MYERCIVNISSVLDFKDGGGGILESPIFG